MSILNDEPWSIRDGETLEVVEEEPTDGLWFAARVVPVPFPDGPVAPYRGEPNQSVEHCAIVAAHKNCLGEWQWLSLLPGTKEHVGNFLVDFCQVERDRWYYLKVGTNRRQAKKIASAARKRPAIVICIKCGMGKITDRVCDECGFTLPKSRTVTATWT